MSVAKLQVSLVRLVRSTMLESLPACLFMDFCELTKPDSSSQSQIGTPLLIKYSGYANNPLNIDDSSAAVGHGGQCNDYK